MIRVPFRRPADQEPWYVRWKARADAETQRALVACAQKKGKAYKPRRGLWGIKKLKEHLESLFRRKCAYCEARFGSVSWGDVEHYRPKKRVAEAPGHEGYYWLAYSLENLLLSCNKCNREGGKLDQFPVENKHARTPEEMLGGTEKPLLLCPYDEAEEADPRKHLRFLTRSEGELWGHVEGLTDRGKATIRVCNLERKELVDDRRQAQVMVVLMLATAYDARAAAIRDSMTQTGPQELIEAKKRLDKTWATLKAPEQPFSSAVLAAAEQYVEELFGAKAR
ncbi:MAG TPA: hypothetical protein VH988_07035 [Thermoanaerobaculia bacterium]|jgi:hypothetical protein|nr:hypothetical protein [Thermoanaerobaculia bacterium]